MRFTKCTFSLKSPLIGVHVGRNPVSKQGFVHIAPVPFFGIDFETKPYINPQMGKSQREAMLIPRVFDPIGKAILLYLVLWFIYTEVIR